MVNLTSQVKQQVQESQLQSPIIFGCGLSRTGNKSLGDALRVLGYKPVKYPKSIEELGSIYDAAVDITVIAWIDELEARFPDAKWIFTQRDIDSWLKSCDRWFGRSLADCSEHKKSYLMHFRRAVYGQETFDPQIWRNVYQQHEQRMLERFKNRPEQFMVMNICGGDSWDKLCNFIGKPAPNASFPSIS
jgi:Sulfotransferase domain